MKKIVLIVLIALCATSLNAADSIIKESFFQKCTQKFAANVCEVLLGAALHSFECDLRKKSVEDQCHQRYKDLPLRDRYSKCDLEVYEAERKCKNGQ